MKFLIRNLLIVLFIAMSALAHAQTTAPVESLNIGISTNEIAITSDFAGADLTVFGALDGADPYLLALGQYDIVVALLGPHKSTVVRKKERVFGIWMNRTSMQFEPLPTAYALSSTRPIDRLAEPLVLRGANVGADNIRLVPTGNVGDGSNLTEFRDAFRRLKFTSGLYQRAPTGVDFVSSSLFRANVRLPANIPVGNHTVRAYLFKHGQIIREQDLRMRVVKTGLEQFIYGFAHDNSFLYGLFAVALAMVTGWTASVVFRKD